MKTIVYTYQDQKPVFFELNRFYKISSKREVDRLINSLLNIDAVFTPASIGKKFPIFLELKPGFACDLKLTNKKQILREIKRAKAVLKLDKKR